MGERRREVGRDGEEGEGERWEQVGRRGRRRSTCSPVLRLPPSSSLCSESQMPSWRRAGAAEPSSPEADQHVVHHRVRMNITHTVRKHIHVYYSSHKHSRA